MPESVSGVDAILDGLREQATGWSCVPLADAVAAVHAAADAARSETWDAAQAEIEAAADARTQEIVDALRAPNGDLRAAIGGKAIYARANHAGINALGRDACSVIADEVARRFPNGGTHDE